MRTAFEFQLEIGKEFFENNERSSDTPYATFRHNDVWIKNFMIKRGIAIYKCHKVARLEIAGHIIIRILFADEAEKPIKVKILDFQLYSYDSFAMDLLQFLFFTVRIDDLRMHFKSFVEYYLVEFVNVLRIVNCPLDDYTNEK